MLYPLSKDNHVNSGVIQALFKEDQMTLVDVASFLTLFIEEIRFFIKLVQASHHICGELTKLSLKLTIFVLHALCFLGKALPNKKHNGP
jgi:hypothetical protein